MIPQLKASRQQWPPEKVQEVYDLADEKKSQGEIERLTGIPQSTISRMLRKRPAIVPTNGHLRQNLAEPDEIPQLPAVQTPAHPSASERISALQRIEPATIRDHEARLMVLEAYVATLQHQLQLPSAPQRISASAYPDMPAHPIAPERTEPPVWVNRGTHIAQDMVDAIAKYAARYRLERREVIDLALRGFFAMEGRGDA